MGKLSIAFTAVVAVVALGSSLGGDVRCMAGVQWMDGAAAADRDCIRSGSLRPNPSGTASGLRLQKRSQTSGVSPPLRLRSQLLDHRPIVTSSSSAAAETIEIVPDTEHVQAAIVVLPGDGIGPEIVGVAVRVLQAVGLHFGHAFKFHHHLIGAAALDATGSPLPPQTIAAVSDADAVLLGAVGDPRYSGPDVTHRPEHGLLQLRQLLGVFANLRPVTVHPDLAHLSKIKTASGADIMFVRELTGGIYFGRKWRTDSSATDICTYDDHEIRRVVRQAAMLARSRRGHLVSVDKANVLETSRLWRRVVEDVIGNEFPDVTLEHMFVDAAAMHLIAKPAYFDVVVTENMFGDILTDLASMLGGSLGLLPSASVNDSGRRGLYEPIHGSAPDIAGQNVANPYGTILSAAMMLRTSLGLEKEADLIEHAVSRAISDGILSRDIAAPEAPVYSTSEIGDAVIARLFV